MQRKLCVKALSLTLAVLLPAGMLLADGKNALLHANGAVNVNGKPVPGSLALSPGDKVSVASDGGATLTAGGSILTISSGSSLTYGADVIDVECGHVSIMTPLRGLAARVRNLTVSPASDSSKFEVSHAGGQLRIAARAGSVNVDDGQQKTTLPEGKQISFDSSGQCLGTATNMPDANNATPQARSSFHLGNGKYALIAAGAGAAIAAGVVISSHGNKHCISPDNSPACKCNNTDPKKCQ